MGLTVVWYRPRRVDEEIEERMEAWPTPHKHTNVRRGEKSGAKHETYFGARRTTGKRRTDGETGTNAHISRAHSHTGTQTQKLMLRSQA